MRHVEVPTALHDRAKAMIASLAVHHERDKATGSHHHYARLASLAAAPCVGDDVCAADLALHRKANVAKHGRRRAPGHVQFGSTDVVEYMVPPNEKEVRLDALERTVGGLLGNMAATRVYGAETATQAQLQELGARLSSMTEGLLSACKTVEGHTGHSVAEERVDRCEARVDQIMELVANVVTKVRDISAIPAQVQSLFESVDQRVDKTDTLLGKVIRSFNNLVEAKGAWDDPMWSGRAFKFSALVKDITEVLPDCLGERLDTLRAQVNVMAERIATLEQAGQAHDDDLSTRANVASSRGGYCRYSTGAATSSRSGRATATSSTKMSGRPIDYSKFESLVVSDDEDDGRMGRDDHEGFQQFLREECEASQECESDTDD